VLSEFGMVDLESKVVQGPSEANFEVFEVEDESSLCERDSDELHVTGKKSALAGTGPELGSESSILLPESKNKHRTWFLTPLNANLSPFLFMKNKWMNLKGWLMLM